MIFTKDKSYLMPAAAISLTLLFWASAFVSIRFLLNYFTPVGLASLRYLIATIALSWVMALRKPAASECDLRHSDIWLFFVFGLLGIVGYNVGINFGEQTIPAATASFIVAQIPIATTIFQVAFFDHRMKGSAIVGLLIGLAGTSIIFAAESIGGKIGLGVIWVLLGVISESAYFVLQQPAIRRLGAFKVNFLTIAAATFILSPFIPAMYRNGITPTWEAWLVVIYLGLFPSAAAYFLWSFAIGKVGAVTTASSLYALPFLTLALGFICLGEQPQITSIIGGLVALFGAYIVHSQRQKLS